MGILKFNDSYVVRNAMEKLLAAQRPLPTMQFSVVTHNTKLSPESRNDEEVESTIKSEIPE